MRVTFLNKRVTKEVTALGGEALAALDRTVALMEMHGTYALGMPHVRKIHGTALWEIRLKDSGGIARIMFVSVVHDEIVLLHALRKKTQKTPQQAIELALQRLKEL